MPSILALDIAGVTGCAYADAEMAARLGRGPLLDAVPQPRAWVWTLNGAADMPHRAYNRALRVIDELRPDHVVIEAPFVGRNANAAEKLYPLHGAIEAGLRSAGVSLLRIHKPRIQVWKKHFAGHGGASKAMVINACRDRGWTPKNDNEADALGILDYACATLREAG